MARKRHRLFGLRQSEPRHRVPAGFSPPEPPGYSAMGWGRGAVVHLEMGEVMDATKATIECQRHHFLQKKKKITAFSFSDCHETTDIV